MGEHEIQSYVFAAAENAGEVAWVGHTHHGMTEAAAYAELWLNLRSIPRSPSWNAEQLAMFERFKSDVLDAIAEAKEANGSLKQICGLLRECWRAVHVLAA